MGKKIQSFKDLIVWQEGHKLVVMVYDLTKSFPKSEVYGLVSQMQRSAVSITSNIAEGFCRQTAKEKSQFFSTAGGSLTELENQLLVAKDIKYIDSKNFEVVNKQLVSVHRLLNAFIAKTKSFAQYSKFLIPDSIKGFTLIEALVATSVFALMVSSILGVYLATLKLDSRTRAQRTVIQDGRFIMDFIGKEVRNGAIDYSIYGGGVSSLSLINVAAEAETFSLNDGNLVLTKSAGSTHLNSDQVQVTKLLFYVSPDQDPFTTSKLANQQPNVTVVLELTHTDPQNPVKINVQSTFEERYYPSRLP
jgi:four helix bundle protein